MDLLVVEMDGFFPPQKKMAQFVWATQGEPPFRR